MRFEEFDPEGFPRPSRQTLYLDVTTLPGGDTLRLAALVVRGQQPGPTIAVLAGVHGDEYEGPHAVRQVFGALDPSQMSGTFVGIPETNVPAFAVASRTSPLDGLNLARVFPGSQTGTPTERIAYCVGSYVISRADFLIDLHSSGTHFATPTLVGYRVDESEAGRRSREAAFAFGAPVIWGHPDNPRARGRTINVANDRGIPWLYTECPGGGWLHPDIAALYARGVTNVMRYLGILSGTVERREPQYHLYGSGASEDSITANAGGFLLPRVKILDPVKKGDLLGQVLGLAGEVLEEVRAESDGRVVYLRANPTVHPGDMVFLLSPEAES